MHAIARVPPTYPCLPRSPPSAAVMNALQAVLSAMFLAGSMIAAAITHRESSIQPEAFNPLAAESMAIASAAAEADLMAESVNCRR